MHNLRSRKRGAQRSEQGALRPERSPLNLSGGARRSRCGFFPALALLCLMAGFWGFAREAAAQSAPSVRVDIPEYFTEGVPGTVTITLSEAPTRRIGFYVDTLRGGCLGTIVCPAGTSPAQDDELQRSSANMVYFEPGGSLSQTVTFEAVDDKESEPIEVARIRLGFHLGVNDASVRCSECTIDSATPYDGYTGSTSRPDLKPDGFYWFARILDPPDPPPSIILSPNPLDVNEGAAASYTAKLALEPTVDVTVTVSGMSGTDLTVDTDANTVGDQHALTFTTLNWSDAQTVNITAAEDDDAGDDTVTLTHTAAGGEYDALTADLTVNIADNDAAGVTITESGGSTEAHESGAADTYDVALDSRPAHDVTIAVDTGAGVTVYESGGAPGPSASLVFTPHTWDTPQTIKVSAVDDALDNPSRRSVSITHMSSSSDADYDGLSIDKVLATVIDDEPTEVTLSTPDSTGTEDEITDPGEIHLKLNRGLVAGETLAIPLGFTGGALGRDFVLGPPYFPPPHLPPPGVSYSSNSDTLTFTGPTNTTLATIVMFGLKDADAQDRTVTASIPSSSTGAPPILSATGLDGGAVGSRMGSGNIVFTDNDEPAVSFASASSSAGESKGTHNITLNLDPAPPPGYITLQFAFQFSGTATKGEDYVSPVGKSALFVARPGDVNLPIPVPIINDAVTEGDETAIFTLIDGAGYTVGSAKVHRLTIKDNDPGDVTAHPLALALTEGDPAMRGGGYTVVLATDPGGAVTITPSSDDPGAVTVSGALTFDSDTWSRKQTVTVAAEDDADAHPENVTITHAISGYVGVATVPDVAVSVTDDDKAGVTADPLSLTVDEGASGNYTVVLDTDPVGAVTVTPSSSDQSVVTVSGALTFDGNNWSQKQTVTVTPADDADADNENATISHAVSGYDGVPKGPDVAVLVDDDETPVAAGVDASPLSVALAEGGSDETYTLVLRTNPGGRVTVTPSSSDPGAVTVSGALTFDSVTWDQPQTVTVTPEDDPDARDETVTITHAVSGYAGVSDGPEIVATVDDDEEPAPAGVAAIPLTVSLDEGGPPETYALVLRTDPGGAVTVTPSSSDPGAVTVSGALTFDSVTWDQPQTVTVTPQRDDDTDDETVTITHAVRGYAGVPDGPKVIATVEDDDEPKSDVSFSSASSSVGEAAGAVSITVNLHPLPPSPFALKYNVGGTATAGADFTVSASGTIEALTGTSSVDIPVEIHDDDAGENAETLILTLGESDEYNVGDTYVHTLTIIDNDGGGPVVAPSLVTLSVAPNPVIEGEEMIVTAALSEPLGHAASIPLAITAGTAEAEDYAAPGSISIAANEASGAGRIVTVTDSDLDDETFAVSLGALPAGLAAGEQSSVEVAILDDTSVAWIESAPAPVGGGASGGDGSGGAAGGDGSGGDGSGGDGSQASVESPGAGTDAGAGSGVGAGAGADSGAATSVEEEIPTAFALAQNYPNPFNPVTTIAFALDKTQHVALSVYDLLGQRVRVLVDGVRPAAHYRVPFDASNLASGTYLYVLQTEEQTAARTMALLK